MAHPHESGPAPADTELGGGVDVTMLLPAEHVSAAPPAAAAPPPAADAGDPRRSTDAQSEAAAPDGHAKIERLTDGILPALIARLGVSPLGELEVRQDGWRVRLRRGQIHDAPAAEPGATAAPGKRPLVPVGPGDGGRGAREGGSSGRGETRVVALSPAVGYYARRDPVGVGHAVRAGDVLGHIDVLGVRHEVVAPADGIVARLLVEQGEAVEYGQELVRIDIVPRPADRTRGTSG